MAIRNTQEVILIPAQPTDPAVRNTQEVVSVVSVPTDPKIRSTQELFLAVSLPSDDNIRVTQHVLLIVEQRYFNPNQYRIPRPITAWLVPPETTPQRGSFQHAALLAATPVFPPGQFIPRMLIAHAAVEEDQEAHPVMGKLPLRRRPMPLAWVIQ